MTQPPAKRPESPIGKSEVSETVVQSLPRVFEMNSYQTCNFQASHREAPVRRIGSGRILPSDMWDFRSENDKMDVDRSDYNFRSSMGGGGGQMRDNRDGRDSGRDRDMGRDRDNRERDDRLMRYDRRSFRRDFSDRDRDRKFTNDRRRTYNDQKDHQEEPEWFSSGPTSQHDTIELHGFDDADERGGNNAKSKKPTPAQKKKGKKTPADKDEKATVDNTSGPKGRSTPTSDPGLNISGASHSPILERDEEEHPKALKEKADASATSGASRNNAEKANVKKSQEKKKDESDFNLDDFLKSDTFPGVHGLLTVSVLFI